ncbi:LVIVD repeat-containing protein, partial [Nocardia sp. NPDC060220]|uniref:LVIVD repeat-containing protein n=1 Tax=Nocardia sp. NPDC060220 TaxID=3347076 RepID=UPI00364915FF
AYFSIYDISDCAHPRLLNPGVGTDLGMPLPIVSHEGGFSPDGRTYWASGVTGGLLSAIDVSNPAEPQVIWQGMTGLTSHGFGITPDGSRMYLSVLAGFTVLDISAVQRRDPHPQVPHIGRSFWSDGQATQHTIPVTYDGKPFAFTVDEGGSGGVKLLDLHDETAPKVVSKIKLEINLPQNMAKNVGSSMGGSLFAYESHYCAADRATNPTALACGWISSGIRVFDIRDPHRIREIAYYNPPALTGRNLELTNSPHALASLIGVPVLSTVPIARAVLEGQFDPADTQTSRAGQTVLGDLSTDWCFSPPEWRGTQLWTTCADNGFMALQLENGVYAPPPDQASTIGQG